MRTRALRAFCWPLFGPLSGVLLPLSFLFASDSQLKYEGASEIIALYILMFFAYLVAAIGVALLFYLAALFLARVRRRARAAFSLVLSIELLCIAPALVVTIVFFLRLWWDSIGHPGSSRMWHVAAAASCVLCAGALWLLLATRARRRTQLGARRLGRRFAVLGTVVAAALVIVAIFLPAPRLPNPIVASQALTPSDSSSVAVPHAARPDILLITFDALSAADMSMYGYARPTTPSLDAFAERAYVFPRAYANANFTTPAVASLLSANRPWKHRVFQLQAFMRGEEATRNPVAALTRAGYATYALTSNPAASPRQSRTAGAFTLARPDDSGYLRHNVYTRMTVSSTLDVQNLLNVFPLAQAANGLDVVGRNLAPERYRQSPQRILEEAEQLLTSHVGRQPVFLWVHLWTPHHFYLPPAPYLYRFDPTRELNDFPSQSQLSRSYSADEARVARLARARYDENIAFSDAQVGTFLERIERRGLLRNAIVSVSSDHGELFDHGIIGHGGPALFDAMIRVPLIVRVPGQVDRVDVAATAEQIDILPTLLDIAGVDTGHSQDGESLLPAMRDGAATSDALSMWLEHESAFEPLRRGSVSVVRWPWKLIFSLDGSQGPMLFDLESDPGEEHDRHRDETVRLAELEGAARTALARAERATAQDGAP